MKQYTIKPLEWSNISECNTFEVAFTPLGNIVALLRNGRYVIEHAKGGTIQNCGTDWEHPTLEAAKLAAEKWYQEQIEQALEQVT